MSQYIHGVETIVVDTGVRPFNTVKTAIIALVGVAVLGPKQEMVMVTDRTQFDQFGFIHPSNTILTALDLIYRQGGALCLVVNVFDPANHTSLYAENHTITGGKFKLVSLYSSSL